MLLKTYLENIYQKRKAIRMKRTLKGFVAATAAAAMISTATPAPAEAQPIHPPISFQLNNNHLSAIFGILAGLGALSAIFFAFNGGNTNGSSIGKYQPPAIPQTQTPKQTTTQAPAPTPQPAPPTTTAPAPTMSRFSDAQLRAAERQVIQEINAYRKSYGLRELVWNDGHSAMALEAARKNDGISMNQSQTHTYGGEVLTRQYGSDLNVAVKQAVQQWIQSSQHRGIISYSPARNGGAGIHQGKDAEGRDVLYFGAIVF